MRADFDLSRMLTVPLRRADGPQSFAAGIAVEAVDEQHAVEMVGLMLDAARHHLAALDGDRLAVHVHALGDDVQVSLAVEVEAGNGQAPLLAVLLLVSDQVDLGIDQVSELVIHVVGEDPQADPELRSGQAGAVGLEHGFSEVLDQPTQFLVESGHRIGGRAQHRVTEQPNGGHAHADECKDSRVLVLSRAEVAQLLDVDALIDALAEAMADLSAGRASVPGRTASFVPEREGALLAMPGYVPSQRALVTKLVSLFPRNAGTEVPTHQAVIVAFNPDTGSPEVLMDGTEITAVRTGACSALSTRLLARADATVLALLGTGVQARSHARAVTRVRVIQEIRVAGRNESRAAALAAELERELGVEARAHASYERAMEGADIVCAVTHPVDPAVRRDWLSPGTHVTSVGYNPSGRELDDETVAAALVCVEFREAVLAPIPSGSPDLIEPIRNGAITADHIHAELGELVAGTKQGRTSDEQLTLYKSVGVAVQDATAATLVLAAAKRAGVGRELVL